jgi:hypothetical protein
VQQTMLATVYLTVLKCYDAMALLVGYAGEEDREA